MPQEHRVPLRRFRLPAADRLAAPLILPSLPAPPGAATPAGPAPLSGSALVEAARHNHVAPIREPAAK